MNLSPVEEKGTEKSLTFWSLKLSLGFLLFLDIFGHPNAEVSYALEKVNINIIYLQQ
jgi:hypothetical protein